MSTRLNAPRVIRRARQRLGLSQEALARSLNATKGAVQHWERGRNSPDLARLLALHRLCPAGQEQMQLDKLIRQTEGRVTPLTLTGPARITRANRSGLHNGTPPSLLPQESLSLLRRENVRLQQKVKTLKTTVQKRDVQLRILQDVAEELHREVVSLRATRPATGETVLSKGY
jgi:transcriptional regulator with XRE-family HTH domain